jgi:predicted permease
MLASELALQLIILIVIGIAAQRLHIVGGDFDAQLSRFVLDISLPCMIIKSLNVAYEPGELLNCAFLLVLSAAFIGIEAVFGQAAYRLMGRTASARIVRFGMIFTNFSFVGMPVVEALYGQQGLFYFVIFQVPMRMIYYSVAKPMLSPPGMEGERRSASAWIRGWFSPPVVAVFIGLALYVSQLQLPSVLTSVIGSVGATCSPLGMILCGISLGKYDFRELLHLRYLALPLVRLMAMPALFYGLTRLLPVPAIVSDMVVICAALPVASLMAAFTIRYEPDDKAKLESAGSVLISTLLCAVTIPLWAYILSL